MKILDKLGMCMAYKGYLYWEDAITIAKRTKKNELPMQKIYEKIAKKYETTTNSVERGMRRSMNQIINLNQKTNTDYVFTNKKLLAWIVRKDKGDE